MKIAILSLYSGHINRGVETWTREIASRLKKKGHELLVLQGSDEKVERIYDSHIVKMRVFWRLRPGENWWLKLLSDPYWISLNLSFSLRALVPLISFRPDIVLPTNGGMQTLLIRIFSKIFGWKMVVTGHAGIGVPDKWNILMRPDVFVSPSKRGKIWAENLFYSRGLRIKNISHGVDLTKYSLKIRGISLNLERPIVLCVSSFESYKRVELAVRAVSRLDKGSLLIIGGDRGGRKLDELAIKLLGNKRYKKIKVKPSDMPKYYSSVDLFTLPSNENEAFGIVYLEALASGLPVVATDDELRREIIGGAGILVNPTDIDSYAKALEKALKTDWGNKPRIQAEKFSWDKVVEKYEDLFEELVQGNKEIQA
jgi:glycosyltransferase involved in cell wall biosynthesis